MMDSASYQTFPNRKDLMSLSTISPADAQPKHKRLVKNDCASLKTNDIEGAQPRLKGYQFVNKPEFGNSIQGIQGAEPKKLHQPIERPFDSLTTHDIYKAVPSKGEFNTKRVGHNPLEPHYQLPHFAAKPPTPPLFIRDSIDITDIEGTRPEVYNKWNTREVLKTNDIEGAQPKPETNWNKPNLMDPKDINKDGIFQTTRVSNPLNPSYQVRDSDGNVTTIGEVSGSKPKQYVRANSNAHSRHLDTSDIEGATAGSIYNKYKDRREFRAPNQVGDIEGAQAGTLKKGVNSVRTTNPLDPSYSLPGNSEEALVEAAKGVVNAAKPDPQYVKSEAVFWGATPPQSVPPSVPITKPPSRSVSRDSNFQRNAARFFNNQSGKATPITDAREFKYHADQFFKSNPITNEPPNYLSQANNASIHRVKPKQAQVDVDSAHYVQNAKNFFGYESSHQSRAGSVPPSQGSTMTMNTELRCNLGKFYEGEPSNKDAFKQNAARFYEVPTPVEPYNFKLTRQEIAKPGNPPVSQLDPSFKKNHAKFYGVTPPQTAGRANSLIFSAQKFFDS